MYEHFEAEKAKKKALSAAEKKALKAEKDKLEEKYMYCYLDGRKEKVGNFRIEPPGLFRGRGEHPKKGTLKVSLFLSSHGYAQTDRVLSVAYVRRTSPSTLVRV